MTLTSSYQEISKKLLGNSGYGNVYLIVYGRVSSAGYDIENNRTKVYAKSIIKTEGGYWYSSSGTTKSLSCTGLSTSSGSANGRYNVGETTLYEISGYVTHNNDGTKSVTISGNFKSDPWGWNQTASGTVDLPTIPRASSVTATNADIGSSTTITINRASTSFTHTLSYSFGSLSGTIVTKTANQSYGWTIPTTFYAQIPNSKTGTCTITCQTYSGSTLVGTKTTTLTVTASESLCKPSVSISAIDVNSTTTALTGNNKKIVRGLSNAQCTFSCSAKNSASITRRTINSVSQSSNSGTYTINSANTNVFTLTVTDSRGYSNSISTNDLTLINYVPLSINANVYRVQPTTGEVAVTFDGNFWNGNFGNQQNVPDIGWGYRQSDESSWTWGGRFSSSQYTLSNNKITSKQAITLHRPDKKEGEQEFDYKKSYYFMIWMNDATTGTEGVNHVNVLPKGKPIINWDDNTFNVNGKLTVNGTNVDNIIKNLFIPYKMSSNTSAMTVSYNDGKVTINNTSGTAGDIFFVGSNKDSDGIVLDGTYTISVKKISGTFSNNNSISFYLRKNNGTTIYNGSSVFSIDINSSVADGTIFKETFTTGSRRFHFLGYTSSSAFSNLQLEIQIEKNDQMSNFLPFAGVMIDSGSNSNGSWIKYSDGTMICYMTVARTIDITTEYYGWYNGFSGAVNFPQTFSSPPVVNVVNSGAYFAPVIRMTTINTSRIVDIEFSRPASRSGVELILHIMAIGRWK